MRRITTDGARRAAPRPAYSVLRSERRRPELPHWRDGLRECLAAARLPRSQAQPVARTLRDAVLVTGGAGFIGSHFVRRLVAAGDEVVVLDKLTYAGNRGQSRGRRRTSSSVGDIADPDAVAAGGAGCDAIVNFAAETHVDRSILGATEFIHTDVLGTQVLLEWARETGRAARAGLDRRGLRRPRRRRRAREETDPLQPVQPVLGVEGRRRPAGPRLRAHVRRRRVDHARREHVRPATSTPRS